MTALEEIKKALEGVTPGPWNVYSEKVAEKAEAIAELAYQVEHTEPFVGEIFMLNAGGKCPALTGCGPCSEANARYIAAVNPATISELLFTLESLQRENDILRASRDGYAKQRDEILRLYDEERISCIREAKLATDMATDCNDAQARAEAAEAEVKRLQAEIDRKSSMPGDHRYWEGRYRDEAAEKERMREALQKVRSEFRVEFNGEKIAGISHDSQSLPRIVGVLDTALASTGGEHHAE